jgi:hypothetical protein
LGIAPSTQLPAAGRFRDIDADRMGYIRLDIANKLLLPCRKKPQLPNPKTGVTAELRGRFVLSPFPLL